MREKWLGRSDCLVCEQNSALPCKAAPRSISLTQAICVPNFLQIKSDIFFYYFLLVIISLAIYPIPNPSSVRHAELAQGYAVSMQRNAVRVFCVLQLARRFHAEQRRFHAEQCRIHAEQRRATQRDEGRGRGRGARRRNAEESNAPSHHGVTTKIIYEQMHSSK